MARLRTELAQPARPAVAPGDPAMPTGQLARVVDAATVRDDADLADQVSGVGGDALRLVRHDQAPLQPRVVGGHPG